MNNFRRSILINKLNRYQFSNNEQFKHNSFMGKILLLTTFGVGYYIYRQLLFITTVNNNIKLDKQLTEQLFRNNYVIIDGKLINSHVANSKNLNTDTKGRIIVVGQDPKSIILTNKLLQNGYEVILINQNDISQHNNLIQEPSRKLYGDILTFKKVVQNANFLFNEEQDVQVNWQIVFEKNITIWILNYFIQQIFKNFRKSSDSQQQKYNKFQQLSKEEMQKFIKTYSSIIKVSQSFFQEQDSNFNKIYIIQELMIQSKFFNEDIINHMKSTYRQNFQHLQKCQTSRFVFDQKGRVIGLLTNQVSQGIVTADYIILSCEEKSKELIHFLGYRLPTLNFRSWQLQTQEANLICDAYEVGGNRQDSEVWAFKKLSQHYQIKIYRKFNQNDLTLDKYTLSSVNKLISPDGLPIIGNLDHWPNVLINVGYNSLGIQECFGGAKLITDYLENAKQTKNEWITLNPDRFYLI